MWDDPVSRERIYGGFRRGPFGDFSKRKYCVAKLGMFLTVKNRKMETNPIL